MNTLVLHKVQAKNLKTKTAIDEFHAIIEMFIVL